MTSLALGRSALGLLALSASQVELPPGPAADALARISADTVALELPKVPAGAWESPATWKRFSELLTAESAGAARDPARRAELALLALAQKRWEDAWARFSDCAASPPALAALLPHFLPGAASGGALEDGAVLRPALPPLRAPAADDPPIPRGAVQRREMKITGLVVGAATISVRVSVEGEGIEIDVEHLSGGEAKLAIVIPADPLYGFADEYMDWYRQEERGIPHGIDVRAGDEAHTLYARFEPRKPEWPSLLPEKLPAQIESGTLWLDPGADERAHPLLEAVAASLASGPLRIEARVVDRARLLDPKGTRAEGMGVRVDLSDAGSRPRKLAWIAGAIEQRALKAPR